MTAPVADPDPLRAALLQRLVDDLAACVVIDQRPADDWRCCWLPYDRIERGRFVGWLHRLCAPLEGVATIGDHCDHWHHRTEVFLA